MLQMRFTGDFNIRNLYLNARGFINAQVRCHVRSLFDAIDQHPRERFAKLDGSPCGHYSSKACTEFYSAVSREVFHEARRTVSPSSADLSEGSQRPLARCVSDGTRLPSR